MASPVSMTPMFSPIPIASTAAMDHLNALVSTYATCALDAYQVTNHTATGSSNDLTLDSDYDGRSDMLENNVDHTDPNNPSDVTSNRLAYFRFNNPTNMGEQGQMPIPAGWIAQVASWSGNALSADAGSSSRLVYHDVETNGWANFNCRQGSARFWFKPYWVSGSDPNPGTFLYMGGSSGRWEFGVSSSGNTVYLTTATNGTSTNNLSANYSFSNRWYQIGLNWSSTSTALSIDGQPVLSGGGVIQWPALSDRTNGLVIGN